MGAFISTKGQNIVQKRLERSIEILREEMGRIKKEMIKDFLDSEEFFDIIIKIFEYSIKIRDEEKIRFYTKILRGAVSINKQSYEGEEYLEIIKELASLELKIVKIFYEIQKETLYDAKVSLKDVAFGLIEQSPQKDIQSEILRRWEDYETRICNEIKVTPEELHESLIRISRTGLLKEITGSYYGYGGGAYIITNLLEKIMQYIAE